jgi:hypothetical protein
LGSIDIKGKTIPKLPKEEIKPGMIAHSYNSSTWKAEAGK